MMTLEDFLFIIGKLNETPKFKLEVVGKAETKAKGNIDAI